jgi:hypothetical protein
MMGNRGGRVSKSANVGLATAADTARTRPRNNRGGC